jgi:hypothetical protein
MINPTIKDIEDAYIELLAMIDGAERDEDQIRILTAALAVLVNVKIENIKKDISSNLRSKIKNQITLRTLIAAQSKLKSKAFSSPILEVEEDIRQSYQEFKDQMSAHNTRVNTD